MIRKRWQGCAQRAVLSSSRTETASGSAILCPLPASPDRKKIENEHVIRSARQRFDACEAQHTALERDDGTFVADATIVGRAAAFDAAVVDDGRLSIDNNPVDLRRLTLFLQIAGDNEPRQF